MDKNTLRNFVFLERFGLICQSLYHAQSTTEEAATEAAKGYLRSGQLITIEGDFIREENKIVGIRAANGKIVYKDAEGNFDGEHVQDLLKD